MNKLLLALTLAATSVRAAEQNAAYTALPTVSCTTVSALAIPANKYRKLLEVQNRGSVIVYLKQDAAHSSTEGISIAAGATWAPQIVPTNAFYCVSASSTASLTVLQGQ